MPSASQPVRSEPSQKPSTNLFFALETSLPRSFQSIADTSPERLARARTSEILRQPVESKTRTHDERVGPGRTVGWRGGVGQEWAPTELFA